MPIINDRHIVSVTLGGGVFDYVDNNSTNRRKSVKQMSRNLYSETAETCTLRCDYCGKYTQDSDLTAEFTKDKYLMCRDCKEKQT